MGERGVPLSGGERQRIALARAFLKGAPVLLLDEPTNSVDVGTEAGIMQALEDLTRGGQSFQGVDLTDGSVQFYFDGGGLLYILKKQDYAFRPGRVLFAVEIFV